MFSFANKKNDKKQMEMICKKRFIWQVVENMLELVFHWYPFKEINICFELESLFVIDICFHKGSVYWQTVTVCQLEIIGRPCQKYQKIFMGTSALPQSFEQCCNSCSFVQSIRGLPTRRNCQNYYIFCERSANNL